MRPSSRLAVTLVITSTPVGVFAQDVEMLGRRYGTRPPEAYFREMRRDPDAFRFKRGRAAPSRAGDPARGLGGGIGGLGGPALALGPRSGPVTGDVFVPTVLGLFADSPTSSPFLQAQIQSAYFGPGAGTVSDYYAEVSGNRIALHGDVLDWRTAALTESEVANGTSGLSGGRTAQFIKQLLALQSGVDWGAYDNDGPDGIPNSLGSTDDDGFVDALAVMHPSRGAECDGATNRIWSHKWSLSEASGSSFTTSSPSSTGGFIRVDDYFIQGARGCGGGALNPIGVFVHETGHAFGLPDLYDTRSGGATHHGAGTWDLMASGTWGCSGGTPFQPCHMGAWSKAQLGWADVTTLAADADHGTLTLPPVEATGEVLRVDAGDGSGEYFLIENRQRIGYDQSLPAEGVLVWQIDHGAVLARWPVNTVNASNHMGVWLRQADGLDELGRPGTDRGDAGDPFPGVSGNSEFHAGSNPASISFPGTATGLTVLEIVDLTSGPSDAQLRVLTRFSELTVTASGASAGGLLTVDGAQVPDPPANTVLSAPFLLRTIEAAAGAPIGSGERSPFLQWTDAPGESRTRLLVTPLGDAAYNAEYSGTEYELQVGLTGGVNGVAPGSILTTPVRPDLWFLPDTDVDVSAVAQTGFVFLDWTGGLAGHPNPTMVRMSAPVFAGADFQLVYAASDVQVAITATEPQSIQLAARNGTDPITWVLLGGALPDGLALSGQGSVSGSAIELGTFPLTVRATDAIGLTATSVVTLDVLAPPIPVAQLASTFLLGGPALTAIQEAFLDRQGNNDGVYDLGDFRAWALANPSLPLTANLSAPPVEAVKRTVTIPTSLAGPESSR